MAGPSPHKPRRKVKKGGSDISTAPSERPSRSSPPGHKPTYPLTAFLWPARGSISQWEVLPLTLMAVGLFRWAAGLWGYSGKAREYISQNIQANLGCVQATKILLCMATTK